MTKPNFTEIVVVLDRSGSMAGIAPDMEGGFNKLIEEQRKVPGECRVSLYQFDDPDAYEVVYDGLPVSDVPLLSLVARGMTALYDAVAKTIIHTGERYAKMADEDRPSKVVFMIITDGQENSSREYGVHQNGAYRVRQLVQHQEEKYRWSFVYLGSHIATHQDAAVIGVRSSAKYRGTGTGVRGMFMAANNAVSAYRGSATTDFMEMSAEIPDPSQDPPSVVVDGSTPTLSSPVLITQDQTKP